MSKYLVEASRKKGLFEPYDPPKHNIMSQVRLSKLLLQNISWSVWSAKWVNLELTPFEQLENMEQLRKYYEQQGYTCSLGLTCSALNYDSKTVEILRDDVDCIPGKGVK